MPFGPSADHGTGGPEADILSIDPDAPRAAADFWGEDSAAVQDALQAPTISPPGPADGEAGDSRSPRLGVRGRSRRLAAKLSRPASAAARLLVAARAEARSLPVPFPVLALFMAAILVIAFVQIGGPGGSTPSRLGRKATHSTGGGTGLAAITPPDLFQSKPRLPKASSGTPTRRAATAHKNRAPHKRANRAVHHAASTAAVTTPASSSEPATTQTTSPTPVSSTPSSSTAGGESTVQVRSTSSGSSSGGSGSSGGGAGGGHSGPVGPGAPFGPGHLG